MTTFGELTTEADSKQPASAVFHYAPDGTLVLSDLVISMGGTPLPNNRGILWQDGSILRIGLHRPTVPRHPHHIKSILPAKQIGQLIAASHTGKSYAMVRMAMAVACGQRELWGQEVMTHGPVIYIAAEDAAGIELRAAAIQKHEGLSANEWFVIDQSRFMVNDPVSLQASINQISVIQPVLVVIDTQMAAFPGLLENDNTEMAKVVDTASRIRNAGHQSCSVVIVHHSGKDSSKGGRGASSGFGGMDFTWTVTKPIDGVGEVSYLTFGKDRGNRNSAMAGKSLALAMDNITVECEIEDTPEGVEAEIRESIEAVMNLREIIDASDIPSAQSDKPRKRTIAEERAEEDAALVQKLVAVMPVATHLSNGLSLSKLLERAGEAPITAKTHRAALLEALEATDGVTNLGVSQRATIFGKEA